MPSSLQEMNMYGLKREERRSILAFDGVGSTKEYETSQEQETALKRAAIICGLALASGTLFGFAVYGFICFIPKFVRLVESFKAMF